MSTFPGRHVATPDAIAQKGDFAFVPFGDTRPTWQWLHLWLPIDDPHHDRAVIPVARGAAAPPAWGWNGNEERPTVTPSIKQQKVVGHDAKGLPILEEAWHGNLVDGNFVT